MGLKQPGLFYGSTDQYSQRISQYAGEVYDEYIGECLPQDQHRQNHAIWRIRRIIYDGAWNIQAILYANRSKEFAFVWSQRATYAYT